MFRKHGWFIVFLSLYLSANHACSAQKHIRVALGEWPPYASASLPHQGLLPLIIKRSYAYSDINVSFEFMSWDEAYDKTKSGDYDISPGWIKTPSREAEMLFSDPVSYIDLRFFHHQDKNFSWESLDETYTLKLGTVSGYSYGSKLDLAIEEGLIKTHQYDNDRQALQGIANKEIDLYPADALLASYILNKLPRDTRDKVSLDEHTISNSPTFLISRPGSDQTIQAFNQGLIKLINSGEYAKILENFQLVNKLAKLNFYTEDNAPINYQTDNGPAGIMVSAVKTLLTELGADLDQTQIKMLPWARAYQLLETQSNTVLFTMTKTQEREDQFKWAGPVYRSNVVLLGLATKFPSPIVLGALFDKHVCAVSNDVGAQLWLKTAANPDKLHLVSHHSQCAKMLNLGRVDLWATVKDTARWHIQKNNLDLDAFNEVQQLKEAFRFIAFSKDVDDEVINSFKKTLSYLQLSGKLKKLIENELKKADEFAIMHKESS